jgi:hypothetical protein
MIVLQEVKNPEVSPGFEGGVEVIQNPQQNYEIILHNCQTIFALILEIKNINFEARRSAERELDRLKAEVRRLSAGRRS